MKFLKKFQMGGAAPAPAPEGGDPIAAMAEAANQVVQSQDCEMCIQFAQSVLEMLGGGAPAQEPVYKRGGKLSKKVCTKCK